jgi:FMN phosphatase YigB (HAD superfamily)
MKIIFDYNRTIFDPEAGDLYEGVLEMLEELSLKHTLYLLSAHEPGRRQTIKDLKVERFFQAVVFTTQKNAEAFKMVAEEGEEVLVVGDNIYSEIKVGNEMNFKTVLLQKSKFSNLLPLKKTHKPKHTISDIRELREVLKQYE